MPFKKGQSGNPGGRPVGSKDKLSRDLKQRVLEVDAKLRKAKKGLEELALDNPTWFYENFYKPILPKHTEIGGEGGGPVEVRARVVFVKAGRREEGDE